ncbi:hypothetical protein Leryth_001223 [Lithospermum erythrorhizon]|nr:hypothetical protein Leryth_001223 [Lithospermum erythrorhizon]
MDRRNHHHSHPHPHHHHTPTPPPVVHHHHTPPPPPVHHHHTPTPVVVVHHHETTHHHAHPLVADRASVKVYCKARPEFALTIHDGHVVLAPSNPADLRQHWVKDEKYSNRVEDDEGFPSFSLINKKTGQALKHSIGATHPVQLIPYNPDHLDESILWTESRDLGDGYRAVRMVNNIRLNVDALNGDPQHGGVHDGTKIVLWEWKKGPNQRWNMTYY